MIRKEKKQLKKLQRAGDKLIAEEVAEFIKQASLGRNPHLKNSGEIVADARKIAKIKKSRMQEIKKKGGMYTKVSIADWITLTIAFVISLFSFFVPHFDIAWMFGILIAFTLVYRHVIPKIAALSVTGLYFLGILTSSYYFKIADIWQVVELSSSIFKWSMLVAIVLTLINIAGAVSGAKGYNSKTVAVITISMIAIALTISLLDVMIYGQRFLAYPSVPFLQKMLIESCGYFLAMALSYGVFYTMTYGVRVGYFKLDKLKQEVKSKEEMLEREYPQILEGGIY